MDFYPSVIGARQLDYQDKAVTQKEPGDIYIKVFFSILRNNMDTSDSEDNEICLAEGLVLRDIVGSSDKEVDVSEKIHETIIIDCSDLIVNDDGVIDDPEGQYMKNLEALFELSLIIDRNRLRIPKANVHVAVYGFELFEDTVRGFSYLVDNDNSLNIVDEKLCSYILNIPPFFDDLNEYGWFLWTDYVGVFEYSLLYQPLKGSVEITDNQVQTLQGFVQKDGIYPSGSNTISTKASQEDNTSRFELHAEKIVYVTEYEDNGNWLDTIQLIFDVVSFVPLVGEVASLVNGIIYFGREWQAAVNWDSDKVKEYRNQTIISFVGAIPGSSVLKGTIRFIRAGKAMRNVQRAQTAADMASRNARKAKQALNRARGKKTSKKKGEAKSRNRDAQNVRQTANCELEKALQTRDTRLREGGWTIEELTDISRSEIRRGYRNIMNTSSSILKKDPRIPELDYDSIIDRGDWIIKFMQFENDHAQSAY